MINVKRFINFYYKNYKNSKYFYLESCLSWTEF